jgi:hypothetical protein
MHNRVKDMTERQLMLCHVGVGIFPVHVGDIIQSLVELCLETTEGKAEVLIAFSASIQADVEHVESEFMVVMTATCQGNGISAHIRGYQLFTEKGISVPTQRG